MNTAKLNQPLRLEYLAFAEVAWKTDQCELLEKHVPHFIKNEPLPYPSEYNYTVIMKRKEFQVPFLNKPHFFKEWMFPLKEKFLESKEKCWMCFVKRYYPFLENHFPQPEPLRICSKLGESHFKKFIFCEGEAIKLTMW